MGWAYDSGMNLTQKIRFDIFKSAAVQSGSYGALNNQSPDGLENHSGFFSAPTAASPVQPRQVGISNGREPTPAFVRSTGLICVGFEDQGKLICHEDGRQPVNQSLVKPGVS